jgi:hypothetical protein
VAKGFTQREGVDYTEIFSPVSCKVSLRIIMALVAHYDLELHQMDVKITFLNEDLLEKASRQWYLKFDETIRSFGFKENEEDNCIYAKFRNANLFFLSCMLMIFYLLVVMLVYC